MRTTIRAAAALVTAAMALCAPALQAQNVHYGESFELNGTLVSSQNHEYTANDYIDLLPGFHSNPDQHKSTILQLDHYGIYPPQEGLTGGPNANDTGVVGAIGGTLDIGMMGGAIYTIPISLPEGINGMQPNLAVTYNSQSGNGLLGWGWDLSGVSAVTRAGTTLYHDGYMSGADFDDDRFYLDGQRLMVVGGTYGTNGAEYKTEVDCMSKVVSYTCDTTTGPAKFKVWTTNGLVMEYGGSRDSRIGLRQNNDVCLWLLNRVEDRNGNYMTYHYNSNDVEYTLDSIKYTYNETLVSNPAYTVTLLYEDKMDKEVVFVGGNYLRQRKLLREINVKYDNDSILWHYYFNYDILTGLGTKDIYHRLTSISYQCGNQAYNPTVITWSQSQNDFGTTTMKVDGSWFHYNTSTHDHLDLGGIKFTGDFNGDGYSDLVTTWSHGNQKVAYVYLCKGSWELIRTDTLYLDENVDWVYTGDFNGDGLSDLLFMNRNRVNWLGYYDFVTFDIYITQKGTDETISFIPCASPQSSAYWIWHSKGVSMAMGDFLGNRRDSFVFQTVEENKHTYKRYYIYYDDATGSMKQDNIGGINLNAEKIQSADFNGDGVSELWYYKTDQNVISGKIIKLDQNKNFVEINGNVLTRYHKLFPGDFNGDGKADFLTFASDGNGGGSWQVNLSKGEDLLWPQYDITNEMGIGDPGDHDYSMQSRYLQLTQFKMVAVADFNGDGKSDIATITDNPLPNDSLIILYAPFSSQGCAYRQAIPKSLTGIGTSSEYSSVLGNFSGRENVSMWWHDDLFSVTPLSDRYTVSSFKDGMGNTNTIQYGYLMPDLQEINWDDYYQMNNVLEDRDNGVFAVSLPIKGVRKITSTNAGGGTVTTSFWYEGAVVHNKGKGFLGFTRRIVTGKNNSLLQQRIVTRNNLEMLSPFPAIVPNCDSVFDKNGNLVSYTQYEYTPIVNNRDWRQKVFVPVLSQKTVQTYDLDHHLFQKKTCVMNTYITDISGLQSRYNNALKISREWTGETDNNTVSDPNNYEFQSVKDVLYETDLIQSWILNRPKKVTTTKRHLGGFDDVVNCTSYTYKTNKPTVVASVLNLPNDGTESNDPLAVKMEFSYDSFGRVITETLKAPNDNTLSNRTTTYEYDSNYGYRFLTSKTLPLGYTTTYAYDEYYGFVESETDWNGMTTSYDQDPMGTTVWTHHPDGTESCLATRWNGHSGYYTWRKSSGKAASLAYYGNKGQLKKTSKTGVTGRTIFTETQYDFLGRVKKESLPYYEGDNQYWNVYSYDDFNRVTRVDRPDGTKEETSYDGLTTLHVTRPVSGTTHETSTSSNVAGWVVGTSEKLDGTAENTIGYGYYADGTLAWTEVNSQIGMRDSLCYDHNGNRIYLKDPDYGIVRSIYNAFGELVSETDPKGNITVNTYDLLGRRVTSTTTHNSSTLETTTWTYDESAGHKGLLASVVHDNQTISYAYDNQLRVSGVTNTIENVSYITTYTYDDISRLLTASYPSSVSIRYNYRANGSLGSITDAFTSNRLWSINDANAAGRPIETTQGNVVVTAYTYDDLTGRLTNIQSTTSNGNLTIQDLTFVYDDFGNLLSRTDHRLNNGFGITESFTYDRLNRLKTVKLNGTQVGQTLYDNYGRITNKSANGQTIFSTDGNSYDMTNKPHALKSASAPEGLFPNTAQNIYYSHFDKVSGIVEGSNSLSYTYGYDHQRIYMEEHVGNTTRTKRYVGNCEYVTETTGNVTTQKWLTYLTGPMGVYAVVVTENNANTIHYVLKDNLGSWSTITNSVGTVEQRLSYDAWGNLRNPNTWSGSFTGTPMFDRGFTGHEHLYDFGLINMNGRMYDPVMSSFLSVDQYVQSPGNSQNFNRYAYCLNNPLSYVDPDGEEFLTTAIVVGTMLIGAYTGGVLTNGGNYNPSQWDWSKAETYDGLFLGGVFGGLSGFAGVSIAGMGFAFCNTASIAASSLIYSTGMHFSGFVLNFNYDISLSFGAVSFDFNTGEFGYPFKKGNSILENIGYCLGAVTNFCDTYRYATWGRLSKQQRYDKLYKWAAKNHGENNMEYEPQLIDETGNPVNVEGTYNWETDKIRITDVALSNDFGYAKSTYLHELNHRLDMTPMKRLLIINKALRSIDWDYYDAACDWHNRFYAACDARSYAVELCNASKNGLSWGQYSNILQNYNYYSQLSGVSLQIPRYSIWTLIKSILLP